MPLKKLRYSDRCRKRWDLCILYLSIPLLNTAEQVYSLGPYLPRCIQFGIFIKLRRRSRRYLVDDVVVIIWARLLRYAFEEEEKVSEVGEEEEEEENNSYCRLIHFSRWARRFPRSEMMIKSMWQAALLPTTTNTRYLSLNLLFIEWKMRSKRKKEERMELFDWKFLPKSASLKTRHNWGISINFIIDFWSQKIDNYG